MKAETVVIAETVKKWKRLFVEKFNSTSLDENSSWLEIIMTLNLTPQQLLDYSIDAVRRIGCFGDDVKNYLYSLPGYNDVRSTLWTLEACDGDGYKLLCTDGTEVFIKYHAPSGYKKAHLLQGRTEIWIKDQAAGVKFFECYVIAPEVAEDLASDMLISYCNLGIAISIAYLKQVPEGFENCKVLRLKATDCSQK